MALLLAAALAATAGGAAGETLTEALAKAYLNNPTLRAARARLRATDETVAQAFSGWRPTVTLSYDAGRSRVDTSGSTSPGVENRLPRTGSLLVTQNLYRGGRTLASIRQAESRVQADRARLLASEQSVLLDAATAYVDVVRDQAVLDLNINNEKVLRRQLEATRDRFAVGEVTRTDVAQAESRLSRATADRIRAQGDLTSARARYRNVIGEMPEALKAAAPLGGLPANEDEAVSLARANDPAVFAARFDEAAARAQVALVAGELRPTLNLEGELVRRDEISSSSSRSDTASLTARLSVPLYQAGAVSARIREAKETVGQRRRDLDRTVRDAVEAATKAWEDLQTARAQIKAFASEVRTATIALEGVEQEAAVGSRTVLDVLDAEQELLDARVNLVRAQRDEVVASFGLRAAVGALSAKKLKLPVEFYDYDAHYKAVRFKWFGTAIGKE